MKRTIFCSICIFITIAILSCTGPTGPSGPQGKTATFVVDTGSLTYSNYDSTNGVWDIKFPVIKDSILIQVWTRLNNTYVWSQPIYYVDDGGFIDIQNDSLSAVGFGYEYMIVGLK